MSESYEEIPIIYIKAKVNIIKRLGHLPTLANYKCADTAGTRERASISGRNKVDSKRITLARMNHRSQRIATSQAEWNAKSRLDRAFRKAVENFGSLEPSTVACANRESLFGRQWRDEREISHMRPRHTRASVSKYSCCAAAFGKYSAHRRARAHPRALRVQPFFAVDSASAGESQSPRLANLPVENKFELGLPFACWKHDEPPATSERFHYSTIPQTNVTHSFSCYTSIFIFDNSRQCA